MGLLLFTANFQKVRVFLFSSRGAIVPLAWNATFAGKRVLSSVAPVPSTGQFAYCSDLRGGVRGRKVGVDE